MNRQETDKHVDAFVTRMVFWFATASLGFVDAIWWALAFMLIDIVWPYITPRRG